ncbi:uncharacterized protein K02A2.6 [Trichonephila clavata]|uniref:Uncharacterized protein K02A2.6 n=1 Tax=Trichonephila clavata TaxID=2740835 RepID=A0A8X6FYK7_TRICU|nr:uncharacterized protein K02A2.6 [Trichonephila clavata]
MEQQIAELLRQNQELIRALQIRDHSSSHKNVPIANRAKVFVSSLSAKLYQILKNLLAPDIPSNQMLDKLKDALKEHLTLKPLIIPSRHKFLNRKQNEGEGTYIAELRALAMNCDYDKDIEEAAKNCVDCARYKADPTKAKVHYWEYPSMPWESIHVDFAGTIFEHMFFLIVDAHSKWLEVYPMKTTTTKKTIECLRDSFARFGLPRVLVSDNGSQFTSYEFQRFMQRNGVEHKTSAPFKPSSNGQAELYVATLKQSLRAMHKYIYDGTIQHKLSTFLMQYRKAPNATTTHSPAILFLKRDIRTRIDLFLPELKTKIQDKLRRDNFEFRDRKFDVGDRVAVRVYRAANTRWKFGTIVNQDGVPHYIIDVQGTLVRRHVDQIRSVGDQV